MELLSHMEEETIAEVGNISLGAAAGALSAILNRRVLITAPTLKICAVNQVKESFPLPCLLVEVKYLSGLQGNNLLLIKQADAAVIAGLMLGKTPENGSLKEMELSAIQEAMNQMMGYMATAMSEMFERVVEISPPGLTVYAPGDSEMSGFDRGTPVVQLTFSIQVEDHIDSKLIQVIPVDFARKMTGFLLSGGAELLEESPSADLSATVQEQAAALEKDAEHRRPDVSGGADHAFSEPESAPVSWNKLDLVREIPLEVTVILGKARVALGELFALNRGGIITLEQVAGSAVEIQINKKPVARGEVVLVDEHLGVRITEHLTGF